MALECAGIVTLTRQGGARCAIVSWPCLAKQCRSRGWGRAGVSENMCPLSTQPPHCRSTPSGVARPRPCRSRHLLELACSAPVLMASLPPPSGYCKATSTWNGLLSQAWAPACVRRAGRPFSDVRFPFVLSLVSPSVWESLAAVSTHRIGRGAFPSRRARRPKRGAANRMRLSEEGCRPALCVFDLSIRCRVRSC